MQQEIQLRISPKEASDMEVIKKIFASKVGVMSSEVVSVRILKRSIDARQRAIFINLTVRGEIGEREPETLYPTIEYPEVSDAPQVIVVGAGPAGLFAALRLIELGIKPIVVERGKNVKDRKREVARISREHVVDSDSNYCFGEGGAGAFSDGKLYTRSKKRGSVDKILSILHQFGANIDILVEAHPHIGTNKLPDIIANIRNQILKSGGEVHFQTRMEELIMENLTVKGIRTHTGKTFIGNVILATGHSAREVYYMLHRQQVKMEAKGFAVGVRIEHPAHLIDQIQYHNEEGRGKYLPAAEYSFVEQVEGRGVYSFCMCPGGIVVPSASAAEQVVVNGMSPANRGSRWSNSGIVVEIHPDDFPEYLQFGELALLKFQEDFEKMAWVAGGCTQIAPAQRMCDFVNGRLSESLPKSSYAAGIVSSPMHEWMPKFVSNRLRQGFKNVGNKKKGYLTNEALLLGVESRTSSPVRILRNHETMQHIELTGLYPCGEGAGYAGGIVSAAMDGERCAEALVEQLKNRNNNS